MTLVVARTHKSRLAIAADTLVSEHGSALPMQSWALKSRVLSRNVCVSFSGSPELAAKAFQLFRAAVFEPGFDQTVSFFERSSTETGNEYILAFADTGRLVTIRDGHRTRGVSKTHWIGDKAAFERFREWEHARGTTFFHGRAVTAAMFADEMNGSPASDLYSGMRNVVEDKGIPSVGGLVTVLSNRDVGFRYSVYSDIFFDWPASVGPEREFQLTDKIDLGSSGENDRYSVNQIAPGYYNANAVGFYHLKGKLLVALYETHSAESACSVARNVEAGDIPGTLNQMLGFDFRALCMVMSARQEFSFPVPRDDPSHGVAMQLYCEVNTMPKSD